MPVEVPFLYSSDPREGSQLVPFHLPQWDPLWNSSTDIMGTISMCLAGAAMFTKNRFFAWPALIVALAGWLNLAPLRIKEGATGGGLQGVTFGLVALLTTYLPSLILLPDQAEGAARIAARAAEKSAQAAAQAAQAAFTQAAAA